MDSPRPRLFLSFSALFCILKNSLCCLMPRGRLAGCRVVQCPPTIVLLRLNEHFSCVPIAPHSLLSPVSHHIVCCACYSTLFSNLSSSSLALGTPIYTTCFLHTAGHTRSTLDCRAHSFKRTCSFVAHPQKSCRVSPRPHSPPTHFCPSRLGPHLQH